MLFFEVNLVIHVGCALYAYILNERTLSAQLRMRFVAFPTLCLLLSRLLRMLFNSFHRFLSFPFFFIDFLSFYICLDVNPSYDFTKRSHIFSLIEKERYCSLTNVFILRNELIERNETITRTKLILRSRL